MARPTPQALKSLGYSWRGRPFVRLSLAGSTEGLGVSWRGQPFSADEDIPDIPVYLRAEPLLELDGAAESQVVQSMWGAGAVSLFGGFAAVGIDYVEVRAAPAVSSTSELSAEQTARVAAAAAVAAEAATAMSGAAELTGDLPAVSAYGSATQGVGAAAAGAIADIRAAAVGVEVVLLAAEGLLELEASAVVKFVIECLEVEFVPAGQVAARLANAPSIVAVLVGESGLRAALVKCR